MSRVRISFPAPNIRTAFYFRRRAEKWRYSQVVRPRSAKPLSPGSNPGGASKNLCTLVQSFFISRCGGIGRRKGLKIPRSNIRAGSSPASGTRKRTLLASFFFVFYSFLQIPLYSSSIFFCLHFFLFMQAIYFHKRKFLKKHI